MTTFALTLSRTIHADAVEVYDAWPDLRNPGGLWHDVERVIMNCHVDGLFFHTVAFEGKAWAHYGRFLQLVRGQTIEFTWMSEATKGLESVVTITMAPVPDGTLVTLRHVNVPDDDLGRSHEGGWSGYLDVLAQRFGR